MERADTKKTAQPATRNSRLHELTFVFAYGLNLLVTKELIFPHLSYFLLGLGVGTAGLLILNFFKLLGDEPMPHVTMAHGGVLLLLLVVAAWAQQVPSAAVRYATGLIPATWVTYLFFGPWFRYFAGKEKKETRDSNKESESE